MANEVVHPGEMRHQVEFFSNQETKNTSNETLHQEVSLGVRRAKIEYNSSGESDDDGRVLSLVDLTVKIRTDKIIEASAETVKIDGVTYQIEGPALPVDVKKRWLKFECNRRG